MSDKIQHQNPSVHYIILETDLTIISMTICIDGWKGSRKTNRTQTCITTPSQVRATLTGALCSPSITSWLRRRLSSLRKSPCSPGMRPNTRSLLVSRCRSGMQTTSLLMTSWVRTNRKNASCSFIIEYKNAVTHTSVSEGQIFFSGEIFQSCWVKNPMLFFFFLATLTTCLSKLPY